jgi:UDP-N-acetylmuramoylalanine--D-glutamate ligase
MQHLEGKRVLVVGLARSGRAAAEFFHRRSAVVTVSDSRPPWSFAQEMPALLAAKIGVEFGQHGLDTFLGQDLIVVSPGVPWDLAPLVAARARGVPVVGEVEAAGWFLRGTLVGVTGSNGKTTTTALLGCMLEAAKFGTFVGGNIGVPLVSGVEQATEETATVAELSSFQLEGTESLHPHVAALLNITPNHLDRHPSFQAYVEAKARIFRNQTGADYAVLNADDPTVMSLVPRLRARPVFFSRTQDLPEGLLIADGRVVYRVGYLERDLFGTRDVKLRGDFNLENVLAATAAACVLGTGFEALARAVREFRGVEHRLEYVGEVLGVEFYNDSKATSVDATVKALGAFESGVHLILGGKDKGAPYAPLIPLLKDRVREALLIGAAAARIAREFAGTVELVEAGNLEAAVRQAFGRARPGEVILLSPACSSYDQFHDFEERGRVFKELVERLAQEAESAGTGGIPFRLQPPPQKEPAQIADAAPAGETATAELELRPGEGCGPEVLIEGPEAAEAEEVQPPKAQARVEEEARAARPGPPVASVQREQVHVYEVEGEERPPLELHAESAIDEVVMARDQTRAGEVNEAAAASEPLIFELPAAPEGRGAAIPLADSGAEASPSPEGGRRKKRRAKSVAEKKERSEKQPQGRFPGM